MKKKIKKRKTAFKQQKRKVEKGRKRMIANETRN